MNLLAVGMVLVWLWRTDRLDRSRLQDVREVFSETITARQEAAEEGLSLQETLDRKDLSEDEGFGVIAVPLVFSLDRDFVLRRAWEEATGSITAADVAHSEGGTSRR